MRCHPHPIRSSLAAFLAVAALVLLAAGCGEDHTPTRPAIPTSPPTPNSPASVVRLFEWCWDQRSQTQINSVFTIDLRFVFALGDSAGNAYRDAPFNREDMLIATRNLFVGGGPEPPATSIVLGLDPVLMVLPDRRPGRDPKWHKEIPSSVDLTVRTMEREYRIMGGVRFFVVRGDSALLPPELVAAGATPDSARWYLEEWRDETLDGGAVAAGAHADPGSTQPATHGSWGALLAVYRGPRPIR